MYSCLTCWCLPFINPLLCLSNETVLFLKQSARIRVSSRTKTLITKGFPRFSALMSVPRYKRNHSCDHLVFFLLDKNYTFTSQEKSWWPDLKWICSSYCDFSTEMYQACISQIVLPNFSSSNTWHKERNIDFLWCNYQKK